MDRTGLIEGEFGLEYEIAEKLRKKFDAFCLVALGRAKDRVVGPVDWRQTEAERNKQLALLANIPLEEVWAAPYERKVLSDLFHDVLSAILEDDEDAFQTIAKNFEAEVDEKIAERLREILTHRQKQTI